MNESEEKKSKNSKLKNSNSKFNSEFFERLVDSNLTELEQQELSEQLGVPFTPELRMSDILSYLILFADNFPKSFKRSAQRYKSQCAEAYEGNVIIHQRSKIKYDYVNALPRELWILIFSHFDTDPKILANLNLVCKKWNRAMTLGVLKKLDLQHSNQGFESLNDLNQMTNLQHLILVEEAGNANWIRKYLTALTNSNIKQLTCQNSHNLGLDLLGSIFKIGSPISRHLISLDLQNTSPYGTLYHHQSCQIQFFSKFCPHLKRLTLNNWKHLSSFSTVNSNTNSNSNNSNLQLSNNHSHNHSHNISHNLSHNSLHIIFPNLEMLDIRYCQSLTEIYLSAPLLLYLDARHNEHLSTLSILTPNLSCLSLNGYSPSLLSFSDLFPLISSFVSWSFISLSPSISLYHTEQNRKIPKPTTTPIHPTTTTTTTHTNTTTTNTTNTTSTEEDNSLFPAIDYKSIFEYYMYGASRNYVPWINNVGYMYYHGEGVVKNHAEALIHFKKAAEHNCNDAIYHIGKMYENGEAVELNYFEAFKWYLKAAEFGDADAIYQIASMFKEGKGVEKNTIEAIKWWKKGSELGDEYSEWRLATEMEEQGDYEQAVEWYRKAAEKRHLDSMKGLSEMYLNGRGVEKSKEVGEAWSNRANYIGESDNRDRLSPA